MKTKHFIQPLAVFLLLALAPGNSKSMVPAKTENLHIQLNPGSIRPGSKSLFNIVFGKPNRMYCQEKQKSRPKGVSRVKGCYKFK